MKRMKWVNIPLITLLFIGVANFLLADDSSYETLKYSQTGFILAQSGLNMRDTPGLKGNKVVLVPFGGKLSLTKRTMKDETISDFKNRWYYAEYKTPSKVYQGWVFGGFVLIHYTPPMVKCTSLNKIPVTMVSNAPEYSKIEGFPELWGGNYADVDQFSLQPNGVGKYNSYMIRDEYSKDITWSAGKDGKSIQISMKYSYTKQNFQSSCYPDYLEAPEGWNEEMAKKEKEKSDACARDKEKEWRKVMGKEDSYDVTNRYDVVLKEKGLVSIEEIIENPTYRLDKQGEKSRKSSSLYICGHYGENEMRPY